jgi:ADP-ribosylglycohydrolase
VGIPNRTIADRVVGCLHGVATGDAIGKQAEMLAHDDVRRYYPQGIRGFEGTPGDVIPRYAANAKHRWRIGETTDDTERTIAVARAIITDGDVFHAGVGREMLGCSKCVHPGVRSLWEFHQAGDPARTDSVHNGCGAAVRVAPVGVFYRSSDLDGLVNGAREASISTHGGALAIAGAAATAAAVSAAIDGAASAQVLEMAERAAALAGHQWPGDSALTMAQAIRTTHDSLASSPVLRAADVAGRFFPNDPLTIVPLALGLATVMQSAEDAILMAANIGGDSDSVASIAGAVLGAMYPRTVNQEWTAVVENVNAHGLITLAGKLTRCRH